MCEYCPQKLLMNKYITKDVKKSKKKKEYLNFTLENFKKCIESVPTDIDLHFTGYSEPFDNPIAEELILYGYEKGHKILVNTTLVGLTKEKFDQLDNVNLVMIG